MDKATTCSFTGHRKIDRKHLYLLEEKLPKALALLIDKGYRNFCSGGALGFDLLAAKTVLSLKNQFPHIQLIMVLPCPEQDRFWTEAQRKLWSEILEKADQVIYTAEHYHKGCMQTRNRCLVDLASIVIAHLTSDSGGTKYTVEYAEKNHIPVIFLPEKPREQLSFFHRISF